MNFSTRDYVNKLRIHELRDFARKVGVSSPTLLKKDILIERVLEMLDKDEEKCRELIPSYKQENEKDHNIDYYSLITSSNLDVKKYINNQHRDMSNTSYNDRIQPNSNVLHNTLPDENSGYYPTRSETNPFNYNMTVAQNHFQYGVDNETDSLVAGIVEIHKDGYAFIRSRNYMANPKDPIIANSLVSSLCLQDGMFVKANVSCMFLDKPLVAYGFDFIEEKNNKEIIFDNIEIGETGDEIVLSKFPYKINVGERVYINSINFDDSINLAKDIVKNNDIKCKVLHIKSMPDGLKYDIDGVEVINCMFSKSDKQIYNAVTLLSERIKRLFENGESNTLIVYNFGELIRTFNTAVQGYYEAGKFDAKAISSIMNLITLARMLDNTSVTVICIDKNGIQNDLKSLMESNFLPYFNKCY